MTTFATNIAATDPLLVRVANAGLSITGSQDMGDLYRVFVQDFGLYQGKLRKRPGKAIYTILGYIGHGTEPGRGMYVLFEVT